MKNASKIDKGTLSRGNMMLALAVLSDLEQVQQSRRGFPSVSHWMVRVFRLLIMDANDEAMGLSASDLVKHLGCKESSARKALQLLPGAIAMHAPEHGVQIRRLSDPHAEKGAPRLFYTLAFPEMYRPAPRPVIALKRIKEVAL